MIFSIRGEIEKFRQKFIRLHFRNFLVGIFNSAQPDFSVSVVFSSFRFFDGIFFGPENLIKMFSCRCSTLGKHDE